MNETCVNALTRAKLPGEMLKDLLATIWRRAPKRVRRWTTRLTHTRFGATAAAIIINNQGQVLLLKHVFRPGSGWGIPGGFLQTGEQPEMGLRRELQEEVGLDLERVELYTIRVFKRPNQIEIVFRCSTNGDAQPRSMEVSRVGWFGFDNLPDGLPKDQRELIRKALAED
ncbi:MAG TPA: NUDIX domain-containing protein [Pyrinomonadaceae bacterium]|nr:NUDIX domain-containing protein [Pyrinomonadaceae bacterium]